MTTKPCMPMTWKVVSVSRDLNCKTYVVSDAEVIPLQSLGVVDVAGTEVKENEILAHALANVSQPERSEGWAIKRSGDFVNEYPHTTGDGTLSAELPKTLTICLARFPTCFHTLLEDLRSIDPLQFLMRATVVGHYATVTNVSVKTTFLCFKPSA